MLSGAPAHSARIQKDADLVKERSSIHLDHISLETSKLVHNPHPRFECKDLIAFQAATGVGDRNEERQTWMSLTTSHGGSSDPASSPRVGDLMIDFEALRTDLRHLGL